MFSSTVADYWIPEAVQLSGAEGVLVAVDASLAPDRSVSLLHLDDGAAVLRVTPARAAALSLLDRTRIGAAALAERIREAGIAFHDPDHVHYLPVEQREALRAERPGRDTRPLSEHDAAAFARFVEIAPEADADEAFVELDHWLVFGTFLDGDLVTAASMYPWQGSLLADLGVLTLPEHRGRGLAGRTVRAISAAALARGHEPQYRCQTDNIASIALAAAAGFAHFATWEVAGDPD